MRRQAKIQLVALGIGLLLITGCKNCGWKKDCIAVPQPAVTQPFAPVPSAVPVPIPPNGTQPGAIAPSSPAPVFPDVRRYETPPTQAQWRQPAESATPLMVPENGSAGAAREPARLQAPDVNASPPTNQGANNGAQRLPSPSLPAGIPNFALAKEQVAVGFRPILDGVDWLRDNGYKSVLHLRAPGEDDSADRKLFELRGMKYTSLEVAAEGLNRSTLEEFNRLIGDQAAKPLFIYDKDGLRSGALWYLQFKVNERLPDEEARSRARRLGLKDDASSDERLIWLAIQKLLADQNP